MAGTMRQLEERQLPVEVTTMLWSPKMDLLAISNVKGEVALHRLTWQRVWLLSPQDETDTIVHLAWRPDGKLLAIYYEISKLLYLVDVETKNIIHKTKLSTDQLIVCIKWLSLSKTEHENLLTNDKPTGEYLPPLPNLIRSYSTEPERKEFLSHTLDMLFIGQKDGTILMYIFGMFYCGTITVGHGPILQITGGSNNPIWITWKDDNCIKITRVWCPLFERSTTFLKVARTQANIECLKDYLSRTLMAICEAWETILLEMDEKFTRYAEANSLETMSADFLDLLMIGIPTKNLDIFLRKDLTEKGLKKFGQSIEMCYSNIQKLVSKNLTSVSMALVYQLAELRGMVRVGGTYEALGLRNETLITNAINESEAFLAKSYEIEQVIDQSMRNYKAFFRWLYVVILQLMNERAPPEVCRVSQQELTFTAEFLSDLGKSKNGKINLEKLGQYLRHENLQTPLTPAGSEWATMLNANECLHNYAHIIKQNFNLSLLQCHVKLITAVENVFAEAYQSLVDHFVMTSTSLPSFTSFLSSQIVINNGNLLLTMSETDSKLLRIFYIKYSSLESVSLTIKMVTINVNYKQEEFSKENIDNVIVDLQFYSQDYLSLLILNKQTQASFLIQMPLHGISVFDNGDNDTIPITDLIGASLPKPFQGISARRLAVSGPRKVAAILSENNRKIRLLETEAEPEDEEEDEEDEGRFMENVMDITSGVQFSTETKVNVQNF